MKTNEEIAADILAVLPTAAPPPELLKRMQDAIDTSDPETLTLRMNLLLLCAMHVEETLVAHPAIDMDALKRVAANELINTAAFIVRGLKRRAGEEIVPARFALVAYAIADGVASAEWSSRDEAAIVDDDGKSPLRQAMHRDRLDRLRQTVEALPPDDARCVRALESVLGGAIRFDTKLARLALEIVAEEQELLEHGA